MAAGLFDITERAARKARELLDKNHKSAVRVKVTAGGCSGMSYQMDPVDGAVPGDKTIDAHGVTLFIDPKSVLYLAGTILDYESTLMSQKFVFKNPNAKHSCSCGESFTV